MSLQMLLFTIFGNFTNSSYSPLSNFISVRFSINSAELGIITSALFIGSLTVNFVVGIFVDHLGPRNAIRIAFLFITVGSLIAFEAKLYLTVVLGYYVIGFGYGIITPSTNSAIMNSSLKDKSTAMGIKQSGVPIGAALSTLVLSAIAIRYTLEYAFLAMSLVAFLFAILSGKEKPAAEKLSINGYFKEFSSALKSRILVIISLNAAFLSWAQQTILTYYVPFIHSVGVKIYEAEIMLVLLLVGAVLGRIIWMRGGEALFGRDRVASLSLIMFLAGILTIIFSVTSGIFMVTLVVTILLGATAVAWNSNFVMVVSEIAPKKLIGVYSGVGLVFLGLGTIIGTPFSGEIRDITGSYEIMWYVLGTGLLIASAIFAFLVRPVFKRWIEEGSDPK